MAGDRKHFLAVGKFLYLKGSPNMGAHSNVFDAHMVPYLGAIFPVTELSESTIPTCISLQIYKGWIVKHYLLWTGWMVSSSFASSRNHALSTRLFPKPLLGHGECKRVEFEQQTCSNAFILTLPVAGTVGVHVSLLLCHPLYIHVFNQFFAK